MSGRFIDTWREQDTRFIHWEETTIAKDGGRDYKIYEIPIAYYRDYTPEQIYNIWMEQYDMDARVVAEKHQAPKDAKTEQPKAPVEDDGHPLPEQTPKPATLHALKTALRHYEKFAYATPENAVHIREQIDRLKSKIERLQDETETTITNTS